LRYRGNEYVTDQTLNRTVYRLFQNDVYLDNQIHEHINNSSVHYSESEDGVIEYLTSDKLVILSAKPTSSKVTEEITMTDGVYMQTEDIIADESLQTYSQKSWQRLIDEQPRNLGGNTLTFRFQKASNIDKNPEDLMVVKILDTLRFSGFYGGKLIIESPEALEPETNYQTSTSAENQRLAIKSNNNVNALIEIENCFCSVIIKNSRFLIADLQKVKDVGDRGSKDFSGKLSNPEKYEDGTVWCNISNGENEGVADDGSGECKRYSATFDKWYDLNILTAIKISNTPDVTVKHCYIEY
jgi:hypothetical protein